MDFTIFDILTWMMVCLNPLLVAKVVTRDKSLHLKEGFYLFIASLLAAILSVINISVINSGISINVFIVPLICLIYFNKIKCYSIRKTLALLFIPMLVVIFVDIIAMTLVSFFFPWFIYSIPNFPLIIGFSYKDFLLYVPYALFSIILSAAVTFLCVTITKKQRKLINQSKRSQTVLATISLTIIIIAIIFANMWLYSGAEIYDLALNTLPLFSIAAATLVCVILYTASLHERVARQKKESEQEALHYYTEQIEQQQLSVRKFKHDQQNILLSMKGYLETDDIAGLKEYFYSQVAAETEAIIHDDFVLESLSKIKVLEIKTILVAKLSTVQSMHINVELQVVEDIDHISVDSVVLVRMLGIILDNAIEALEELQSGTLSVACYRDKKCVVFIVQNTCPADLPPLSQLSQFGYSTKIGGRGLGLNNLFELASAHQNIILQTNIVGGNFIQKLSIGD
ncbi:MAG: GHKL domain-containing protein [Oscillospiraceae bacterium]|nr:GHKL domain-containing protein [Oscillospiraceae bacterium]